MKVNTVYLNDIFEMGRQASKADKPRNLLNVPEYLKSLKNADTSIRKEINSFMWSAWYRGYDAETLGAKNEY